MTALNGEKPSGILNPQAGEKKFALSRHAPAQDLCAFVQRYWIVKWDFRAQEPYLSETLPYPCVNLVFEQDNTRIYGVVNRKFTRLLEGKGQVFGIKFRPGGFYPFVKFPVSQLTDRSIRFQDVFGIPSQALEATLLSRADESRMVELVEAFLREHLPERDEMVDLINQMIDHIVAAPEITKVDDVVRHFQVNTRWLQRIFNQYVGVSPKWVIKRARLQEAADQLSTGAVVDLPQLALALGYFDQAHFSKDFKTTIGRTPGDYARQLTEVRS